MADHAFGGIQIRHLYKIFGPNAQVHVEAVKNGLTKTELNERYGHVLGLRDINIEMPSGSIQVIMGLSGSGKSTLIRHINRLIDPTAGEVLVDGVDVVKMPEAGCANSEDIRRLWCSRSSPCFLIAACSTTRSSALKSKACRARKVLTLPCDGWNASVSKGLNRNIRTSFPAECSSASALPGRLPMTHRFS